MSSLVVMELCSAGFVALLFLWQLSCPKSFSMRKTRFATLVILAWLIVDALSYILVVPNAPFFVSYTLNLLSYCWGSIVLVYFLRYCHAYITEKTKVLTGIYLFPELVCIICAIGIAIMYFLGKVDVYNEEGVVVQSNGIPTHILIVQMIAVLYAPVVAFFKRKTIGFKPILLMGLFNISTIPAMIIASFTGRDYTPVFGAFSFVLIILLLQAEVLEKMKAENLATSTIAENNSRIMALQGTFEFLYDVDLENEEYEIYVRDTEFYHNLRKQMVEKHKFFEDSLKNNEVIVYEDDREEHAKILDRDYVEKCLETENQVVHYYRLLINGQPIWFCMRIAYKNDKKNHLIIGVFNATEKMNNRKKEEENRNAIISQMMGGESTFIVNVENGTYKIVQQNDYFLNNYSGFDSYSAFITEYINRDVIELDREKMSLSMKLENIVEELKTEKEATNLFRDISSGIARWYKMRAAKLSDSELIIGFINYDHRYYANAIRAKVEDDYFGMYVADLDSQIFKITKSSPYYYTGKVGDIAPFVPALTAFAMANEGETRQFFENLTSIEYIRNAFATEDKISNTYKSAVVDGHKWVTAECLVLSRHNDGTPAMFALGFRMADKLMSEKNELQAKMEATRIVMEILTEDFGCVNYVKFEKDKTEDVCVNYRVSDLIKELVPEWEKEKNFSKKIAMLCERVVYEEVPGEFFNKACRERIFKELKDKNIYFVNFRVVVKGEICYYEMKVTAVREAGELFGMVVGIRSVDEYIKKELAYQANLEAALKSAEDANRSKTKFLFNMSHDIRTPMNAILGFANMAKKHLDDEEKIRNYVDKIQTSGQQLLTLINEILEMSRIDSGKMEVDEEHINILKEHNAMITVLEEQAREKGLKFEYSVLDVQHENILADKAKTNSIILNITGNAMKYTMEGGSIYFNLQEVPSRKDGYASYVFTIRDTGIGMSEEYQKVLFEPFTREKNSTVSKIQGTGLGMPIVKELVKLLDGDIEVQSKLGKGTTFVVTLDFKIDEEGTHIGSIIHPNIYLVAGHRVLLVEDNELNREIARDVLEEVGLVVEEADDGTVAVDLLKEKGPRYYDAVLMDIQMPIMDGYEASKAIRKMYPDEHVPIIALSANAFEEDRALSLKAGMDNHVAKPINPNELVEALSLVIK